MKSLTTIAALVVALAIPATARAQAANDAWGGRTYVTFAAGAQTASPSFGYEFSTQLFEENAKAGLKIPGKSGMAFDVGGGVRLIQNLGVGVVYSRYSKERNAVLTTTIPSPLFYNESSTITQNIPLQREENAIHIQAMYRLPLANRLNVGLFGGPTYFRCIDDTVSRFALAGALALSNLNWNVNFRDVTQAVEKDSTWGYHGGADVTYLLSKHFGLNATMRYSRASHDTQNPFSDTNNLYWQGVWGGDNTTATIPMKHGGMQWNGGVSFHF